MYRLCRPAIRFPDFVFLDLFMHGMSGFECISQIRKQDKARDIKIIIYAIDSFASTMERAFFLGADFYAVKPNAYTDLKNLVKIVFQTH
jgi:PleD family two-component response regulator